MVRKPFAFSRVHIALHPAAFGLVMLAGTDAGNAYTYSQYEKMLANAGFVKTTLHPVPEMPKQVLHSEK